MLSGSRPAQDVSFLHNRRSAPASNRPALLRHSPGGLLARRLRVSFEAVLDDLSIERAPADLEHRCRLLLVPAHAVEHAHDVRPFGLAPATAAAPTRSPPGLRWRAGTRCHPGESPGPVTTTPRATPCFRARGCSPANGIASASRRLPWRTTCHRAASRSPRSSARGTVRASTGMSLVRSRNDGSRMENALTR